MNYQATRAGFGRTLAASAAATLVLSLCACGVAASPTSSTTASQISASTEPAAQTIPIATSTAPQFTPTATATAPRVTGFGATTDNWEATHTADTNFAPGSAYDPDPSLGTVNGRAADTYYSVNRGAGVVDSYLKRLHDGTPVSQARANAMTEFPADARQTDYKVLDVCALMVIQSAELGQQLAAAGYGDSQGYAMVGLYTALPDGEQTYDTININEMSFGSNLQPTVSPDDRC